MMMRLMIALLWMGLMAPAMASDEDRADQGVTSLVSPEEAARIKAEAAAAASGVPATSRPAAKAAPSEKAVPAEKTAPAVVSGTPSPQADDARAPAANDTSKPAADDMRALQTDDRRPPQTEGSASKSSIPLEQRKGGDITQCLEQGSNQAIALCAEKYRP